MTLKEKMKTVSFWVSLVAAALIVVRIIFDKLNLNLDETLVKDISTGICGILVILGILTPSSAKSAENTQEIDIEQVNIETKNAEMVVCDTQNKQESIKNYENIEQGGLLMAQESMVNLDVEIADEKHETNTYIPAGEVISEQVIIETEVDNENINQLNEQQVCNTLPEQPAVVAEQVAPVAQPAVEQPAVVAEQVAPVAQPVVEQSAVVAEQVAPVAQPAVEQTVEPRQQWQAPMADAATFGYNQTANLQQAQTTIQPNNNF